MSQQTLCKNQFSFRLVGVRILLCVDLTWNDPVSVWLKIWKKLLSINILSSYHALLVLVVSKIVCGIISLVAQTRIKAKRPRIEHWFLPSTTIVSRSQKVAFHVSLALQHYNNWASNDELAIAQCLDIEATPDLPIKPLWWDSSPRDTLGSST